MACAQSLALITIARVKPRILLAITGGVLGLAAGVCAAFLSVGVLAGILWLFVFGDNPWPDWTGPLITAVALVIVLVSIAAGAWIGYRRGERMSSASPGAVARQVAAAAILVLLFVAALGGVLQKSRRESNQLRHQQQELQLWTRQKQRITSLQAPPRADGSGWDVQVNTAGEAGGRYLLRLELQRQGAALLTREATAKLAAGENRSSFSLDNSEILAAYSGRVFRAGATNLAVEESADVRVTLLPVVDHQTAQRLGVNTPTLEQFADARTLPLKINFQIGSDGQAQFRP